MSKKEKEINFAQMLDGVKTMNDFEGIMGSLYKQGIQHLLESEMSLLLGYEKHNPEGNNSGNSRNGYTSKKLKSTDGELEIKVPRDRNSDFDPLVVPKGQSTTQKIEQVIIGLYSRGMSTADITNQIEEIYGLNVSKSFISSITDKMVFHIQEWQNRSLEALYLILWMDCIVFKVRHEGKIINKSIYIVLGLKENGKKEVLGLWIHQGESASFWLNVMTDLKERGVQDVLIACTDNLAGFTKAIEASFPQAVSQLCMVHQIRNSIKYVPWNDRKLFLTDLKLVYKAVNLEEAELQFQAFKNTWSSKYPYAIRSWEANWKELTAYFEYPPEMRKIMYTTNTIEGLNRGIRKFTKTKTIFPTDQAAIKSVYLAIEQIERKWTMPIRKWNLILNQFLIKFEERFKILKN